MSLPKTKKIAFFTEGQTEQIFLDALLQHIAADKNIAIESRRAIGGRRFNRTTYVLKPALNSLADYFALIWDSGSDGSVTSDIRDQYTTLVNAGYSAIIAVRDVYPQSAADIPKIKGAFAKYVARDPVTPVLILSTLEVEAWFIGEQSHFERIDAILTAAKIQNRLGIDIDHQDVEAIPHPADQLDQIYQLAGHDYQKSKASVARTVGALDLNLMIEAMRAPSMEPLVAEMQAFLS